MVTKTYVISPDKMTSLNDAALKGLFECAPDFLFAFSPDTLRHVCSLSRENLYVLQNGFSARNFNNAEDAATLYERPGYLRPMTDQVWFSKMYQICKDCHIGDSFPADPDESGFADYEAAQALLRAERQARLKAKQDAAEASLAAKSNRQSMKTENESVNDSLSNPSIDTSTNAIDCAKDDASSEEGMQKKSDAPEQKKSLFLTAQLYDGQLHISVLFTGSRLISIGTDTRMNWPASKPLVISKISGLKAGSTQLEYAGEELHVGDIETWATAVRFGAKLPLGEKVPLVESQMLKAMRRGDSDTAYDALREQILRLQGARLILKTTDRLTIKAIASAMPEDKGTKEALVSGKLQLVIPLLGGSSKGSESDKSGTVYVTVPNEVRALFGKGLSTWFNDEKYYSLRSRTARRLYLLYERHVEPWPFTRDELREYLGSTTKRDIDFHGTVMRAFKEMVKKGVFTKVPEYKPCKERHGAKAYIVAIE